MVKTLEINQENKIKSISNAKTTFLEKMMILKKSLNQFQKIR